MFNIKRIFARTPPEQQSTMRIHAKLMPHIRRQAYLRGKILDAVIDKSISSVSENNCSQIKRAVLVRDSVQKEGRLTWISNMIDDVLRYRVIWPTNKTSIDRIVWKAFKSYQSLYSKLGRTMYSTSFFKEQEAYSSFFFFNAGTDMSEREKAARIAELEKTKEELNRKRANLNGKERECDRFIEENFYESSHISVLEGKVEAVGELIEKYNEIKEKKRMDEKEEKMLISLLGDIMERENETCGYFQKVVNLMKSEKECLLLNTKPITIIESLKKRVDALDYSWVFPSKADCLAMIFEGIKNEKGDAKKRNIAYFEVLTDKVDELEMLLFETKKKLGNSIDADDAFEIMMQIDKKQLELNEVCQALMKSFEGDDNAIKKSLLIYLYQVVVCADDEALIELAGNSLEILEGDQREEMDSSLKEIEKGLSDAGEMSGKVDSMLSGIRERKKEFRKDELEIENILLNVATSLPHFEQKLLMEEISRVKKHSEYKRDAKIRHADRIFSIRRKLEIVEECFGPDSDFVSGTEFSKKQKEKGEGVDHSCLSERQIEIMDNSGIWEMDEKMLEETSKSQKEAVETAEKLKKELEKCAMEFENACADDELFKRYEPQLEVEASYRYDGPLDATNYVQEETYPIDVSSNSEAGEKGISIKIEITTSDGEQIPVNVVNPYTCSGEIPVPDLPDVNVETPLDMEKVFKKLRVKRPGSFYGVMHRHISKHEKNFNRISNSIFSGEFEIADASEKRTWAGIQLQLSDELDGMTLTNEPAISEIKRQTNQIREFAEKNFRDYKKIRRELELYTLMSALYDIRDWMDMTREERYAAVINNIDAELIALGKLGPHGEEIPELDE